MREDGTTVRIWNKWNNKYGSDCDKNQDVVKPFEMKNVFMAFLILGFSMLIVALILSGEIYRGGKSKDAMIPASTS